MMRRQRGADAPQAERPPRRVRHVLALLLLGCVCVTFLLFIPVRARATHLATSQRSRLTGAIYNTPLASSGCGKAPPFSPGTTSSGSLLSGGITRAYWLHIPRGYRPAHPYPLILVFHGHASTAHRIERATGFSQLADRVGLLAAYPVGLVGPDGLTGWASGGPHKPRVNDVLFVSDLLNRLQAQYCVNPDRIYATGFSNGGGMTSVLACALARRIAAFAPVSGSYFTPPSGCHPGRPVPILEFHGTDDGIVPYAGRPRIGEQGAWDWAKTWAARDACALLPDQLDVYADVTTYMWTGCQGHATVIHYRLVGGAHAWPGAGLHRPLVDAALNATSLIWQFFTAHPLPSTRTTV
jgi:polyhydroxybutyrate depolymerase